MKNNFEIFERFSRGAREILLSAQRYAESMKTGFGSEHILLTIVVTPNSLAHQILKNIPLTLDQMRLVLQFQPPNGVMGTLTREAKIVIEKAAFRASSLVSKQIEVEHLLWAILAEPTSNAYQLFIQTGIEPEIVKLSLEKIIQEEQEKNRRSPLAGEIEILGMVGPLVADQLNEEDLLDEDDGGDGDEDKGSRRPSLLDQFTIDLTKLAEEGKLDPLIGRQAEIERLINILGRKTKNNPVLIGEPGVGKTAIVEGLAQLIVKDKVPEYLIGSRLLCLELAGLVAGTIYRGQFEERLKRIIKEVIKKKNIILFIDEIHAIVGAGSAEGALDAANILKPMLAKGSIRLIGATTTTEYKKHIEKDAALERRLQPVVVAEPSIEETVKILEGLRPYWEKFHHIIIPQWLIKDVVELAREYLHDRFLPDKAIDLLDEAAASIRSNNKKKISRLTVLKNLERELKILTNKKDYEIRSGNLEKAAFLRSQELKLKIKLKKFQAQNKVIGEQNKTLDLETVRKILAAWTGIPVNRLNLNDRRQLLKLESSLNEKIIDQIEPIKILSSSLRRAKSGIKFSARPLGVFLLVGPTGVGKTQTARVIAEEVFGGGDALIKLDMSEFMEKHQVARILGAPPGYVGFDEANRFLESIRRRPHRVILFDEIEKAHPDIFHLLLQIMEDGVLTDSQGRKIDFSQCLILMTSNVGSKLWDGSTIGFKSKADNLELRSRIEEILKQYFQAEFLARLDDILIFEPLSKESLHKILDLEIEQLAAALAAKQGVGFNLNTSAKEALIGKIIKSKTGARAIRKLVTDELANRLADGILKWPTVKQFNLDLVRGSISLMPVSLLPTNDLQNSSRPTQTSRQ